MNNVAKNAYRMIEQITFDLMFCGMFAVSALFSAFPMLENYLPSSAVIILPVMFAFALVLLRIKNLRYITHDEVILLIVFFFYVFLSVAGNAFVKNITFSSSFVVMVVFALFLLSREDLDDTIRHLRIDAYIVATLFTILAFQSGTDIFSTSNIYMAIGYGLSLPSIILFETANQDKKLDYVFSICFMIILSIFGNRGAFLTITVYFMARLFTKKKHGKRLETAYRVLIIIFLVVFVVLGKTILVSVLDLLSSQGLYSRSLERLLNSNFAKDSGRTYIWAIVLNIISATPLAIHGPGYLVKISHSEPSLVANAHNLVLEFFAEYGIVIGAVLTFMTVSRVFVAGKYCNEFNTKSIKLSYCLLLQATTMLMLSGTIYNCNEYWLGLILLVAFKKKVKNIGE